MGSNLTGVVISKNSFCTTVKAKGPGLEQLEECKTTEEVESLTGDKKGEHHGSNLFLLAPFMVKSIVNAKSRDPLELILSSLKDGIDFDKDNSTEDETTNQGRDHAVSLANLLW